MNVSCYLCRSIIPITLRLKSYLSDVKLLKAHNWWNTLFHCIAVLLVTSGLCRFPTSDYSIWHLRHEECCMRSSGGQRFGNTLGKRMWNLEREEWVSGALQIWWRPSHPVTLTDKPRSLNGNAWLECLLSSVRQAPRESFIPRKGTSLKEMSRC